MKLEKDMKGISRKFLCESTARIDNKILKLIPKTIITRNDAKIISRTLWNIKKGRKQ
jgi:hypothetical protein